MLYSIKNKTDVLAFFNYGRNTHFPVPINGEPKEKTSDIEVLTKYS